MRAHPLLLAAALVLVAGSCFAADNLVSPSCWQAFAPRAANAPRSGRSIDSDDAVLTLASPGRRFVYGGWRCRVDGITGGSYYRLQAQALPANIESPRESLTIVLRWKGDFGGEVAPSYVWDARPAGEPAGGLLFDSRVAAPPTARAVEVELILQWSKAGEVTWRKVRLNTSAPPEPRKARIATLWFRPNGARSGAESAAQAAAYADTVARDQRPDVVLLGEVINHRGSPGSFDDDAEAIPGPTTERFAVLARKHAAYFAFSILERSGPDIFNTAVLIDRHGTVVGTYRKVQLPFEEVSAGEAPGESFPVFQADFGRVGLMICHDTSFSEPARELALGGAELILVPIAGGRTPLVRARAIENGVYLATAGYDYDSEIVDPVGRVLASAPRDKGPAAVVADIDFSKTFPEDWIGHWRDTVSKQRRSQPYTRK